MKLFRHIILTLAALILASCAVDEFWGGPDHTEGEEVVMTFKPTFEDFETATKAIIGDGTQVNTLLVHVYEGESNTPMKYTYNIYNREVENTVSIPFFHGKEYTVYFFAYKAGEGTAYKIADNGLKGGVTVTYPTESLGFDALEALDAFYAVKTVNLSANVETSVSLTRPFAQVNLTADKEQLLDAKATEVKFEVSVATSYDFKNGAVGKPSDLTFSFVDAEYFQNNDMISEQAVFLGTTYLFVPKVDEGDQDVPSIAATVTLYDEAGNPLKGPSEVSIPLASNNRTNLVFSGIEPAGPSWDDNEVKVPGAGADGWIHITRPEQLAAFLLNSTADGAKICIDNDIDMSEIPEDVATNLAKASKSVKSLTLNGNNKTVSGLNLSAFFNEATNLSVYDLTLSNITVEGTSHVGVLVNTLKGDSSFSNIDILNSSAVTTNGAAGGVVGYIVRDTQTSRAETLSVSFDDCDLDEVIAEGSIVDGKFVGRLSGYDNGEVLTFTTTCSAKGGNSDSKSKYLSFNLASWLTDTEKTAFSGWIGDEVYYRGKVSYGNSRVAIKWDGTTTVEPLLAHATYDPGTAAGTNRYVVYSAFDLAGLRKKTASPAALYLMANVDMFGQGEDGKYFVHEKFTQSKNASTDDKNFTAFSSIALLEGNNNGIYNLALNANGSDRYAFILSGNNGDQHRNVSFYNCCTVVPHVVKDNEDKSYGATVVLSISGATYTMDNVHAYNCKVFALQKTGIIAGRVTSLTMATISNCSVNDCYIENYDCKDHAEAFGSGKISTTFYTPGEVGGFIGFIENFATISNCHVKGTTIYAFGQDNKKLLYIYTVYGRHVGLFIGDIRTSDDEKDKIVLTNCTVDSNTKCTKRWDKHGKCNMIGCVYSLPLLDSKGTVTLDGKSIF